MPTAYDVFDKAERIELLAAEIYRVLARAFAANAEAKALFEQLESEEVQHASRVRMLASQYRQNTKAFKGPAPKFPDAEAIIREAETLLAGLTRECKLSFEDAKALMLNLEDRFSVAHAEILAASCTSSLTAFLKELAAHDKAHRDFLSGKRRAV